MVQRKRDAYDDASGRDISSAIARGDKLPRARKMETEERGREK